MAGGRIAPGHIAGMLPEYLLEEMRLAFKGRGTCSGCIFRRCHSAPAKRPRRDLGLRTFLSAIAIVENEGWYERKFRGEVFGRYRC